MNLAQIFADKSMFELALSVSGLQPASPEREALVARAGLGAVQKQQFLRTLGTFDALRESVTCVDCNSCVDDNTLAEFVDGVLEETELAVVEQRLAHCGACLRNAVFLAQLAHELAPATPWKEVVLGIARRGLRFVTAPLDGFAELTLQPVPALATATASARRWTMEDNGVSATFTVTLEEGGMVAMTMGFEHANQVLRAGRVALHADDILVEMQPIGSSWEHHTFWHIEPGRYLIEVTLPNHTEARFPVTITEGEAD